MDYVIICQVIERLNEIGMEDDELSFLLGKANNYVFGFIVKPSDKNMPVIRSLQMLPQLKSSSRMVRTGCCIKRKMESKTILPMNSFFVITGGPGVGKTTLIDTLAQRGYRTVEENARQIIKEQVAAGTDGVPWSNKERYAELMMNASVISFTEIQEIETNAIVFFDRGLLDTICYMNMENLPISTDNLGIIDKYRYNKYVFILPPWPEIYTTDDERKQDWHEVIVTHEHMKSTYEQYGYLVVEIPKTDVQSRCDFILRFLKENCNPHQ